MSIPYQCAWGASKAVRVHIFVNLTKGISGLARPRQFKQLRRTFYEP
jgi:hypothetical protein